MSVDSAPSTMSSYRALISVHISGSLTNEKVKRLVQWILALDKSFGLSVDSVYHTNSTGLLIKVPYSLYSKLCTLPGIGLVFENTAGNIIPTMDSMPSSALTSIDNRPRNTSKENK